MTRSVVSGCRTYRSKVKKWREPEVSDAFPLHPESFRNGVWELGLGALVWIAG